MKQNLPIEKLIDDLIEEEKNIEPATISAAGLSSMLSERMSSSSFRTTSLQKALVVLSLAGAIISGVMMGNLYHINQHASTSGLLLINDEKMEHFEFYNAAAEAK